MGSPTQTAGRSDTQAEPLGVAQGQSPPGTLRAAPAASRVPVSHHGQVCVCPIGKPHCAPLGPRGTLGMRKASNAWRKANKKAREGVSPSWRLPTLRELCVTSSFWPEVTWARAMTEPQGETKSSIHSFLVYTEWQDPKDMMMKKRCPLPSRTTRPARSAGARTQTHRHAAICPSIPYTREPVGITCPRVPCLEKEAEPVRTHCLWKRKVRGHPVISALSSPADQPTARVLGEGTLQLLHPGADASRLQVPCVIG